MKVTLKNVTKKYDDKTVLNDISYVFDHGVYGLLGANGAGKSTLLNTICGSIRPNSGDVLFDDLSIKSDSTKVYTDLGFLPQEFRYYPEFTGLEFLIYIGLLKGSNKKSAKKQGMELLDVVGLSDVKKKKIRKYSGGMKQRLGIAQALINDPQVLVLDEPTVGLDPQERVRFRNLISSLSETKTVILSTHIVSDVEYIAKDIIILKDGVFKEHGTLAELLSTIKDRVWEIESRYTKELNGSLDFTVVNKKITPEGSISRIVASDNPGHDAKPVEPTLEDLYIYYFNNEGGLSDVVND